MDFGKCAGSELNSWLAARFLFVFFLGAFNTDASTYWSGFYFL